jgi:hypothetical protein
MACPICYNCGKPADSKDHLPPKAFFPADSRSNLITVPCCACCNNSFSILDEKFRVFVSTEENRSAAGQTVLSTKVLSKNSIKGRPFREVGATLRPVWAEVGPLLVQKWKLSIPKEDSERFLFRLTKGLVFKYYPELHRDDPFFHLEYLSDPNEVNPTVAILAERLPFMRYVRVGNDVFECWHEAALEGSLWAFQFYRGARFLVTHSLIAHPLFERKRSA